MDCQRAGQPGLDRRKIRIVLLGPPLRGGIADGPPFVEKQPYVDIAIRSMISTHTTAEQIDGWNAWRRLDPVCENFGEGAQLGVQRNLLWVDPTLDPNTATLAMIRRTRQYEGQGAQDDPRRHTAVRISRPVLMPFRSVDLDALGGVNAQLSR